ncbi:rhomboid family intramembrane serine protease [Nodosilinea sp. P-1105]|uniref:rhomboid family intramembrane serine protease n=1 Tax=Nodosilinea sp. P-1105 TaxID=2546229 RepID=UPI00146C838F|nr:rhomboid family intramembrane serine protease [Nodosilinea sp. P-1105]
MFTVGRWWTVFTAGWLHGGFIHIVFNLFWIYHLGPWVAKLYGAGRLVIIYVASTVTGAALTSAVAQYLPNLPDPWQGAHLTVGASGAVLGLLGAMVSHGQRTRNSDLTYRAGIYSFLLILIGFFSVRGIDNWGHIGGFLGGYLLTQFPGFNSCQPQRLWGALHKAGR